MTRVILSKTNPRILSLGGQRTPLYNIVVDGVPTSLFSPQHLEAELNLGWAEVLLAIGRLSSDHWFVSSVYSSLSGKPRINPGGVPTSHVSHGALDIAPVVSWDQPLLSSGRSPRLAANLAFMQSLLSNKAAQLVAVMAEDDHLHLDVRFAPGVYSYWKPGKYVQDRSLDFRALKRAQGGRSPIMRFMPDGSSHMISERDRDRPLSATQRTILDLTARYSATRQTFQPGGFDLGKL